MISQAEQLMAKARSGERLTASERRHCVSYCLVKEPDLNNVSMGELFQVTERVIREDRKKIRQDRAKLIKEDDIGLVIADIAMSFENQVIDIERSKKNCKSGSRDYLEHCKSIFNIQLQKVKALQDLGYYPKNLGNMTVDKYEYLAVVAKDGSVNTRPVNLQINSFRDAETIDAEVIEPRLIEPPK